MEKTANEVNVVSQPAKEDCHPQFNELCELQLALVGGGMGEVIVA